MTDGSTQGLFVIIAVIIFGIFILISYALFRDKMSVGLASVFDDSITQTISDLTLTEQEKYENTIPFEQTLTNPYFVNILEQSGDYYKFENGINRTFVTGIQFTNNEIIVPYGHKLIMEAEVRADREMFFKVDLNGTPVIPITEQYSNRGSINDSYNKHITGDTWLKPNEWTTISSQYTNMHNENVTQSDLRNHTVMGFSNEHLHDKSSIIEFKNARYKLVKVT